MKVLLASMPDAVSAFDNLVAFPNTGLCSIAGNLQDCEVRILGLVARRRQVKKAILEQLNAFQPDVVGLSAMTFQYGSAIKTARIVRDWNPDVPIVLGGYHGSLYYQETASSPEARLFDFIIRGEGEVAFAGLMQYLGKNRKDLFQHYNGFIANVKTRYMSSLQLAREMVKAGVRYYNDPRWMLKSLLWQHTPSSVIRFFLVNLRFIYSGWRNHMFHSTHRF